MTRTEAFDKFLVALHKVEDVELFEELGKAATDYANAAVQEVLEERKKRWLKEMHDGN